MSRQMPAALMAKFLQGVEEKKTDDTDWKAATEVRPSRLGLGADPRAGQKKQATTNAERRVVNMVKRDNDPSSSDSEDEGLRSKIGRKH